MSNKTYYKNIRRTIFGSMGRYIAILAIIALGVGFFAGVKNTKGSMMITCDEYVKEHKLYDYRLISTYGFTEEDVEALAGEETVAAAEGSITADFFSLDQNGNSVTIRAHAITDHVNTVDLQEGRLPEAADECVADDHFYTADDIGKTVQVTDENDSSTKKALTYQEYKIVGIIKSPYYLMKTERGNTSLGDGQITAYVYMPEEGFTSDYFTELLITCKEQGFIFSEEYEDHIAAAEEAITEAAEKRGQMRYDEVIGEAKEKIEESRQELEDGRAELERERADALSQLSSAKATLEQQDREIAEGKESLSEKKTELSHQKEQAQKGLKQAQAALEAAQKNPETPQETLAELETQITQLNHSIQQIDEGLQEIAKQEKELAAGESQLQQGYQAYYDNNASVHSQLASAEAELANGEQEIQDAEQKLEEIEKPELFVQTREDNLGFSSFESNADIVDGIAKVFPVFFFLIAALVCSTTMSRMIEEERTQIGTLRALGFTNGSIMWKYMIYSGSAALIGCIAGFFAGSKYFPYAIWTAYGMMFGFAPLKFYFSWPLALISLVVALICSTGTTYLACRGQLGNTPAEILRPRTPKAGKRILLERIGFLWNRLKFLHKVTARNILRYKKRMFMMVLGIGGCTALVLAGFGINDSVAGVADHQFSEIEKYDMTVAFSETMDEKKQDAFDDAYGEMLENTAILQQTSVKAGGSKAVKSCSLMVTGDDRIEKAVVFAEDGQKLRFPEKGEAMLSNRIAEMTGVTVGDRITIEYDDTNEVTLTVSGIYKNYVSNYIYITDETWVQEFGNDYEPSMAFVTVKEGEDLHTVSEQINDFEDVTAISLNEDVRNRVDDMMVSLNYIIILVIGCAGALAFIVLFNLSNINITEREREIATIEVLGFYPRETGAYVFRENLILVLCGIVAGLPAGFILHRFIMSRIVVDFVAFNEVIEPQSYGFTVVVVLCFAFVVDIIMRRKLKRINMAEALKSIE